uniref:histone acetyltransferase n=1 Tax=Gongylonema pulchrum TaxID=637853 RepID=A0A183D8N6_9BILA
LKPVLDKLLSMRASMPFKSRLRSKNPEKQHAIDLSVISSKLRRGLYKNPWDFNDDMWLMFENAWMCHRKNSKVYSYCNKLSQVFVEQINPVMKKLGYCCGQKLSFTPPSLYCDGNSLCTIARDQYYHVYEAT